MNINRIKKIKRYLQYTFLPLVLIFSSLHAGDYTASFLDIGVGSRPLAMGGAFCSIADDGSAFYWNPAGLSLVRKTQISGMYGSIFGSIQNPLGSYHFLGFTHPLKGEAAIAFNWIRLSVDEIPIYSELAGDTYWDRLHDPSLRPDGNAEGYIADTEDAFYFSFSKLNRWEIDLGWYYHKVRIEMPFGVNIKWLRQRLGDGEASGLGVDVGSMIRVNAGDFFDTERFGILSFGITLQDLTSTTMTWNTRHQDPLPLNMKWGISYTHPIPRIKGSFCVAYDRDSRWHGRNHWGMEFKGFQMLGLRLGFDQQQNPDKTAPWNLTCGIGFRVWKMNIDYAFLSHELSAAHRISCTYNL